MVELQQTMAVFFNVFICIMYIFRTERRHNYAEAAHRRLQTEMGVDHPSIWKLIGVLRKIQKARDSEQLTMNAGYLPPQKKTKIQRSR